MTIRKITKEDADAAGGGYPKNLGNVYNPPKQLYVNGTLLPEDAMAVALVGSRRASLYGIETCDRLAFELASRGVTIVSGMARGIDTAAHRGALRAKGRTIAVMGSGHKNIYPPENADLYKEIVKSGAVITEYRDDMLPLAQNFPARNRIISGLSLGVVVVEAARNSGALITADFAAEQGRTVFAIPGKVSSATSSGTHELIKDGAVLVQSVDDIMEELALVKIAPVKKEARIKRPDPIKKKTEAYVYNSLTEAERKVYKVLSENPLYIDEVADKSGLAGPKISEMLLRLQVKKLIRELPGKNFVRTENGQEEN